MTESSKKMLLQVFEDTESMLSPFACKNSDAIREFSSKYKNDLIRTQFAIDIDKILHSALYNRGNDKTQVFSFFRNDDITRRSTHVQLVSRISRIIGRALRLNLDLIEAIAIGHDIGHTPFGHKGEKFLNDLYVDHTGRYFNHNVHSVRVLQKISGCNLTLQTLDGILCHCGEKAFDKYQPSIVRSFDEFNQIIDRCYAKNEFIKTLRPSTLEGCVVRISDMIAYIGKDRQDASKAKLKVHYLSNPLGETNPEIINTIITDIIINSIQKPYISLSPEVYCGIDEMIKENNNLIYQCDEVSNPYFETIKPMMELLYNRFLSELMAENHSSLIYQHYLNGSITGNYYRHPTKRYVRLDIHDPNDIVVDFIASMTDDYFLDVFSYLYPNHKLITNIRYVEYFDKRFTK